MPDVTGWSTNEIIRFCELINLPYKLTGYGKVKQTSIPVNTVIDITNMTLEITLEA